MRWAVLSATLLIASVPAAAQAIYRCTTEGNGTEYSQKPCSDGQLLNTKDPSSEAERKQAKANALRDEKLASSLKAERHARERAANGQKAAGFRVAEPAAPASAPKEQKLKRYKVPKVPKAPSKSVG